MKAPLGVGVLRHRIVPAIVLPPWMAGHETLKCHPASFKWAIFFNRLHTISAAGRRVAALHSQERRYSPLIKADNAYEYYGKDFTHYWAE
jgi:hypothetical protein